MKTAIVLTVALVLSACATAPLPPDVKVVAPAAALPADVKAFSGKWSGKWDGELEHSLIVEEIDSSGATVVYSWGVSSRWNIRPGWQRVRAEIASGAMKFKFPNNGPSVSYALQDDGTLKGIYDRQGQIARATLTRANP